MSMTAMDPKLRAELAEILLAAGGKRSAAERLLLGRLGRDDALLRRLTSPYLPGIVAHALAQLAKTPAEASRPHAVAPSEPETDPAPRGERRMIVPRQPVPRSQRAIERTDLGVPAEEAEELPRPAASPAHAATLMMLAKAQAARRGN